MREILFRGKREDNGKWVYGSLLSFGRGKKAILPRAVKVFMHRWTRKFCFNEGYDIAPDTVGQYTGLTDKNRVKIFEGDIVTINGGKEPVYVAFVDFSFQLVSKRNKYYKHRTEVEDVYTVIGNIHDNPGLLDVEVVTS